MKKIPGRKCSKCGIYHNLAVEVCNQCQTQLNGIPVVLIDRSDVSAEQMGTLGEDIKLYVQKCSNCSTLNFTTDKEKRVKRCSGCGKIRVAEIEPVEYIVAEEVRLADGAEPVESGENTAPEQPVENAVADAPAKASENEADSKELFWLSRLRDRVAGIESAHTPAKTGEEQSEGEKKTPAEKNGNAQRPTQKWDDDEDDDDIDWPDEFTTPVTKKRLTLTAIGYGRLSFTIEAEQGEYWLGRAAHQSEFLAKDKRVGNEHCYLFYKDGAWHVKDSSQNGTFVSSRDIGDHGESVLNDGDVLTLGHEADSMAFRVTIK